MTWGAYSIGMTVFFALVGIVMLVNVIYAQVVGLALYHKLPKGHAFVATIIPLLILFLLIILPVLTIVWFLRTSMMF